MSHINEDHQAIRDVPAPVAPSRPGLRGSESWPLDGAAVGERTVGPGRRKRRGTQNEVMEIQRGRILRAAAETVAEVGYARMTVGRIILRARVSRKTFYDVFTDRDQCFMAVFEEIVSHASVLASDAFGREGTWREGIRAAIDRLLAFLDEEPGLARLWVVDSLGATEGVLERRAEVLESITAVIDRARADPDANRQPPALSAEGVVGGVFGVLHTQLLRCAEEPLTGLIGPLMYMVVLPYFGAATAAEELKLGTRFEACDESKPRVGGVDDPLKGLNIRLTFRTIQVLAVINRHPGASNREVAEGSGITDQGQISKLLARLARGDLIVNQGAGQERGAANAWRLTRLGTEVVRATRG